MSRTRIVVRGPRAAGGRPDVRVETAGPEGRGHLAVRMLPPRAGVARVALLAEGALLLGGDEVEVEVLLADGTRLEVVEPTGTVAYDMRGDRAAWRVTVDAGEASRLTWRGQSFVVSDGAVVERSTTVRLGPDAVVALAEQLVLGRSGEEGGALVTSTHVATRQSRTDSGHPGLVLVEHLDLDGAVPRVGVLGGARVLETVAVLGRRAPHTGDAPVLRLDLEAEGTLLRWMGQATHHGALDTAWQDAVALVMSPPDQVSAQPPRPPGGSWGPRPRGQRARRQTTYRQEGRDDAGAARLGTATGVPTPP